MIGKEIQLEVGVQVSKAMLQVNQRLIWSVKGSKTAAEMENDG